MRGTAKGPSRALRIGSPLVATLYLNEDLHPDAFAIGARVPVWGGEARHAAQVSRVRTGERIGIGDGRGRIAWGPVVHVANDQVAITAESIQVDERPAPALRLVQALAKGDRDELAIQAATELGVARVVPWQAARSVPVWKGDKVAKGLERWRSVVREAAKQAIRPTIPEVGGLLTTKSLIESIGAGDPPVSGDAFRALTLVLEPSGRRPLSAFLDPGTLAGVEAITLVAGPEGGISPEELVQLEAAGAAIVRLGSEVLRTSTAGPAALAAIHALLGRW